MSKGRILVAKEKHFVEVTTLKCLGNKCFSPGRLSGNVEMFCVEKEYDGCPMHPSYSVKREEKNKQRGWKYTRREIS